MNFSQPFGGIMPGARGATLDVLLRTGAALTGRRVHALVQGRHSLTAVQQALRELEQLGLISTETVGRAGVHRINDQHDAIGPLRSLRSPLAMLKQVVGETVVGVEAVIVFGSVARGDAHAASDIDLAVVAEEDWGGRDDLVQAVQERLGNHCDVVHVDPSKLVRAPADREPVVAEVLRDGVTLFGEVARRRPKAAS